MQPCKVSALTYEFVKNVPLVYVDSDECLVLPPLELPHTLQVLSSLVDESVQHLQELVVRLLHNSPIVLGVSQRVSSVSRPQQLDTQ